MYLRSKWMRSFMIDRVYLSAIVTEAVTFFSLKHFSELDIAGLVIGMGELDAIYLRTYFKFTS